MKKIRLARTPYKAIRVKAQLERMIRKHRLWGGRLKSDRDLAIDFGVSRQTLRHALADLEAQRVIVRRHGSGTYVLPREQADSGKKKHVAVIVQQHDDLMPVWSYYPEMMRAIKALAIKVNADVTFLATSVPEEAAILHNRSAMSKFDGFLSISEADRTLLSLLLDLKRGPVVLLDHFMRDLPVLCIVDSSFRAARKLARHLIAQGHTRIAFINCHTPDALNPEKFAGFEAAMHEKGLEVDPELVAVPPHYLPNEELQKFIDKFIGKILALPNPPTALFAFNDLRALMATKSLQARGINIGTDFAVAGFGDGAIRQRLCDWLTSSRIQVRKIGEDGLRAALSGRNLTEGRTIVVPNRLIIRASTMPIGRTGARKPVTQLVVAHV